MVVSKTTGLCFYTVLSEDFIRQSFIPKVPCSILTHAVPVG